MAYDHILHCTKFHHLLFLVCLHSLFSSLFTANTSTIFVHSYLDFLPLLLPSPPLLSLPLSHSSLFLMANMSSFSIITVMDSLWFHQIILLSEASTSLLNPKTLSIQSSTLSLETSSDDHEQTSSPISVDDQNSQESPPVTLQDESNNIELKVEDSYKKERPTRLNLIRNRARSHSSSPVSSEKRPRHARHTSLIRNTLQNSRSCRSMGELELEEVKGFMDLGFIFKKEHLSPRMIKVIPGLQRLGLLNKTEPNRTEQHEVVEADHYEQNESIKDHEEEEEEEKEERGVIRPYLSEAWLIKRPDSPLLNLRMPSRISASADMKRHIKSWARTVASVIQQES